MAQRESNQALLVALIAILATLLLVLVGVIIFALSSNTGSQADTRILFIGNSYTGYNRLDQTTADVIQRSAAEQNSVYATAVAPGGRRVPEHLSDAMATGTPLNQYLVDGDEAWDLVIMQEQSQIPGLDTSFSELNQLYQDAPQLAALAQERGATVMLYMTWGRRNGDPQFPSFYPDFLTMQARLTFAYDSLAASMSTEENPVYVAPVGLGFLTIYEDVAAQGVDPTVGATRFTNLYAADGSHPSAAGSYLAALIISASYTGQPVSNMGWEPAGVDNDTGAYLREVADRVVFGDAYTDRAYIWR